MPHKYNNFTHQKSSTEICPSLLRITVINYKFEEGKREQMSLIMITTQTAGLSACPSPINAVLNVIEATALSHNLTQ